MIRWLNVIVLTILVVGVLKCASPQLVSRFQYWPNTKGSKRESPIVLLVDADFTSEQRNDIWAAIHSWEVASSYKVVFDVKWDRPKPGLYKDFSDLKEDQGIFLWSLTRDLNQLTPEQKTNMDRMMGLCVYGPGKNSANLLVFPDIPKSSYAAVVKHELGHLLGLKHTLKWSVMHPSAVTSCLTIPDAQQLCEIYKCTPKPECDLDVPWTD